MISCGKKAYIRAHSLRAFLILCSYQEVCGTFMILEFMQILLWYWQTKQREFGDTVKFFSQLCRWCHRIFPIQKTCCLDEKEIQVAVTKLVNQFITDNRNTVSRPVKVWITFASSLAYTFSWLFI